MSAVCRRRVRGSPAVPIWSRRSAFLGRCLAVCMYSYVYVCIATYAPAYTWARRPARFPLQVLVGCVIRSRCPRTWSRRCPGDGPWDPAGGGARGCRGPALPRPALCVCVRLAAPPPSPGRQVPWAGWLERERCLPSHARHELVESCDSPDAFLDIHSSYSASGKGESITGSTSVCVGGGRERTTDNGFVEGMILGFNYYFSGFSVALGCIAARGLSW